MRTVHDTTLLTMPFVAATVFTNCAITLNLELMPDCLEATKLL
jgi:hypothetical protein